MNSPPHTVPDPYIAAVGDLECGHFGRFSSAVRRAAIWRRTCWGRLIASRCRVRRFGIHAASPDRRYRPQRDDRREQAAEKNRGLGEYRRINCYRNEHFQV